MSLSAALVFACACNLTDNTPPGDLPGTGGTDDGAAGCFEAAAGQCLPGQQFIGSFQEGDADVVLVDDPEASVGVGPNAWLVSVGSSADWVGSYEYDGGSCTVGCGWCAQGQSLCHGGFDEDMYPKCPLCLGAGVDDPGDQCATWIEACPEAGDDEGGLDETGGDEDSGRNGGETGDEGLDETSGAEYDCALWDPAGAVSVGPHPGTMVVDMELVEEIVEYFGDPLADCDNTRFGQQADGYFAVRRMSSTGLLAKIGLREGDAILALDGERMSDPDTVASAAVALFLGNKITEGFTLTYRRGRATEQLRVLVR